MTPGNPSATDAVLVTADAKAAQVMLKHSCAGAYKPCPNTICSLSTPQLLSGHVQSQLRQQRQLNTRVANAHSVTQKYPPLHVSL
jgi:hypothetical protein